VGLQTSQAIVGQRERLLALGSLSAGLTHELNNPAAAAVRATSALRERIAGMRHKLAVLASGQIDRGAFATLVRVQEKVVEKVAKAPKLSAVEAADREDEVGDWLESQGIGDGWDVAPVLVQGGIDVPCLADVVEVIPPELGPGAVRWMTYTVETELLMSEIEEAVNRISTLVGAARQYSQLDRSPHQVVDVHDLLDSTLVMLAAKLTGITVVKEYDRSLPQIPAYASELNQVWTNLVDNAAQAMAGSGTLTVRTSREGDQVVVEIGDTGPGIPPEVQGRVYEPFFTTKAVGQGTGLGLDISWRIVVQRHHGNITLKSSPGDTRFTVRLPISQQLAST
jgi:signal transduction histidine kinase